VRQARAAVRACSGLSCAASKNTRRKTRWGSRAVAR
jgi:hypothetical protein